MSSGVLPDASDNFVKSIEFVYKGTALAGSSFQFLSGAPIQTFSYNPNANMDSSYKAVDDKHIHIDFYTGRQDDRFDFTETSTWTIKNVSLTDFTSTYAEANNKPSPIYSIISLAPYNLDGVNPTPSNWVAAVPEPETYAIMLTGLGLLGFMVRRRKGKQA